MNRTIKQAEKDCRDAWKKNPSKYGWCIHHEIEVEKLTEPIENRISYVINNKATEEIVTRLDNLRPVISPVVIKALKAYEKAKASAYKAYKEAEPMAWKSYEKATAPACKAFEEATAPACKAFEEATAPARKVYYEATATARKAYNEAVASALKARDEITASARKVFKEAVALAHAREVPGHTWNGENIF